MIFRQIQILLRKAKTTTDLLQLYSHSLKTALDYNPNAISNFVLSASSISIEIARSIFENSPITPPLFAWNTIIRAYTKSSSPIESVTLFSKLQKVGLEPDNFTYPFVLKACGCCSIVRLGGSLHSMVLKAGLYSDRYIGNTLLRMYGAFREMGSAKLVFDEMSLRDVVSFSSMIAVYVACNQSMEAFKLFRQMKKVNQRPNSITLVSLLSACTSLLDISSGKSIHAYITMNHIELDVSLGTSLLEMYSKCGNIDKASIVFNSMNEKNLQSWTVMISCLADHGKNKDAITLFNEMERIGLKPDSVSFSTILSACSHLGMVNEGRKYFDRMVRIYKIKPRLEHYGCLVDLLGRAGMIEEAYEIIKNMPMEPNSVILRSLMSAVKNHDRVFSMDEKIKKKLIEIEPDLGANYVIAANKFSLSGCWNDAEQLRLAMKEKGLKKVYGWSSL